MFNTSIILNTDGYKPSHWPQYPPGTEYVSAYIESRGGQYPWTKFIGLQPFIKEYLTKRVTYKDIQEAKEFLPNYGIQNFNEDGWKHIVEKHDGALPLRIKAVREGTVVPTHNALVTVENTDPACFWLPSYIEPPLLRSVWYPTTVATKAYHIRQIIKEAMLKTCDSTDGIDFMLNDFGSRGVSSYESAALGGLGMLSVFKGTDNIVSVLAAREYYRTAMVAGFTVKAAAEHSTITSWGKDNEAAAYGNMLMQFATPGSIVAVVSDSYDIIHAVRHIWGEQLRTKVMDSGATIVIRPDSGDPVILVPYILQILAEKFGFNYNSKGFKKIKYVKVLQGDGINDQSIQEIMDAVMAEGFSVDNICFGMGGALLQQLDRDTLKFAMKTSAMKINGEWKDVFKDPVTDPGKRSKKGRQMLYHQINDGTFLTGRADMRVEGLITHLAYNEALETIFENGKLMINQTWEDVLKVGETYA